MFRLRPSSQIPHIPRPEERGQGKRCTPVLRDIDNLSLSRSFDSGAVISIIPGIDFTTTLDEGSPLMHLNDLPRKWSIGSGLGARGQDDRNVEHLRESSMREDVVPVLVWRKVPDKGEQTQLVINNKKSSVILTEPSEGLVVRYMS
ncbi:unnamed protein product [Tuber aestivum]|uniref:Uncharacterized protein n=1 Tax=Tuber aestivum TaxID=59557 RepID=A0A292PLI9_9PEZI|nr:unnamed protein product [Tuber aestivum]